MKSQHHDHSLSGRFAGTEGPQADSVVGQSDQPMRHQLVLHLMFLYGTVILVLGFVWVALTS